MVIAGLFIFVLGGGLGVFYQSQKDAPQLQKIDDIQQAIKKLSSKVVPSLIASGQVTKIDGRNITLSSGGDNITINVKNDALVYAFVADSKGVQKQQPVDFSQVKTNSNVSINCKLLADGALECQMVIIAPVLPVGAPVK